MNKTWPICLILAATLTGAVWSEPPASPAPIVTPDSNADLERLKKEVSEHDYAPRMVHQRRAEIAKLRFEMGVLGTFEPGHALPRVVQSIVKKCGRELIALDVKETAPGHCSLQLVLASERPLAHLTDLKVTQRSPRSLTASATVLLCPPVSKVAEPSPLPPIAPGLTPQAELDWYTLRLQLLQNVEKDIPQLMQELEDCQKAMKELVIPLVRGQGAPDKFPFLFKHMERDLRQALPPGVRLVQFADGGKPLLPESLLGFPCHAYAVTLRGPRESILEFLDGLAGGHLKRLVRIGAISCRGTEVQAGLVVFFRLPG